MGATVFQDVGAGTESVTDADEGSRAAFEAIKGYVGFSEADAKHLARFHPCARPHFEAIVAHFYDKVTACPEASAVITGGQAQIDRLKRTMIDWLDSGLAGPHDLEFCQRRRRTGDVHVRIGLPQHLMVTAMSVIRIDLRRVAEQAYADDSAERSEVVEALHRWLDMELAIMIEAYRAASEEQLRRRARLATIGQLAATIAHDLRNPLSVLDSSLYILRRHVGDDGRLQRHVKRMSEQLGLSNAIISDLLEVARESTPRDQRLDVADLVTEVLDGLTRPDDVQVDLDLRPGLRMRGDRGLLRQALSNLVGNAFIALRERGGRVRIVGRLEGDDVWIGVEDDGPGFPEQILPEVFQPLVTTRPKGTGLGLALVESVARRHGGVATAGNGPDGGARVFMRLPLRGPPQSAS